MPDFALVSLEEARLRTMPGRQGRLLAEYARYIQLLTAGQAGILSPVGNEKPTIIRRRLAGTAQALGTKLVIKRAGEDIYFWKEAEAEEESKSKRRYARRRKMQEERTAPEQPFIEPEEFEQAVSEQASVSDAI